MPNPSSKYLTSLPVFQSRSKQDEPKTVICFGTARGGTSMVAGAILGLGVHMGDEIGTNIEDPRFNLHVHGGPLPDFLEALRPIISQQNKQYLNWGWKFPAAAQYLDKLVPQLRNPHLVCVYRDPIPANVRKQFEDEEATAFTAGRLRAQIRNVTQIEMLKQPSLMVSYEKAALHQDVFLSELASFLNIELPESTQPILKFMSPGTYKDPKKMLMELEPSTA